MEIGSPIKHLRREEAAFGNELRISLQFVPVALLLEREFWMIRVEFADEFIQDVIEYAGTSDLAGFRVAVVVCIRSAHPVQGDDAAAFHVEVELLMGHFQCLLLVGSDFRQAVLDASVQGLFEWNSSVKLDSRVADGFTGVPCGVPGAVRAGPRLGRPAAGRRARSSSRKLRDGICVMKGSLV